MIESCLEIEKLKVRLIKSFEPAERSKFFGDNDDDDESVEIPIGNGEDDGEGR